MICVDWRRSCYRMNLDLVDIGDCYSLHAVQWLSDRSLYALFLVTTPASFV